MNISDKMRRIMNFFFLILLGLVTFSCTHSNSVTERCYTDVYRLDFDLSKRCENGYPWLQNPVYSNFHIPNIENEDGRKLLKFCGLEGFPIQEMNQLKVDLYQKILMPLQATKDGCVRLECKGNNLRKVALIIGGETEQEKRLFLDTLLFNPDSLWGKYSISFPSQKVSLLSIRIYAEGIPMKPATLTLSRCAISLDGKPIDDFEVRVPFPVTEEEYTTISLNVGDIGDSIFSVCPAKIIGLCESVHRSSGIQRLEANLIMEQVHHGRTKLILIERSLESSLAYNHYIHHEEVDLDTVLFYDAPNPFLLEELRMFNAGRAEEEQVSILGIDYEYEKADSHSYCGDMLFDFLVWVNTGKQSRAVNQLAELVVSGEWYQANGLFKGRKAEMLEILSGEEYECIDLVLRYAQKINKDRVGGSIARDSMMFERSRFLIEHLGYNSERIFLCGQVSHLNLASSYPNPIDVKPLGKALKDRYGGEYMCYLLSVSSGNTERYGQDFKIEDRELQLTPEGSLEYSLMERKYLSVYVPITRKLDRLLLTRWGGLFQLEQEFYPMNLYSRYNGLFFVTDTVLNTPKRNTDIMVKDINRQKYRKKIMCEILSNGKK
jgi:hypothetical protein